jgi:hypothetical protein
MADVGERQHVLTGYGSFVADNNDKGAMRTYPLATESR